MAKKYQLNKDIQSDSLKELGQKAVEVCGLSLDNENDKNIGRLFTFLDSSNRGTMRANKVHRIICRQMAWGYNSDGKYTMLEAYRAVLADNEEEFGVPCHLYEMDFID